MKHQDVCEDVPEEICETVNEKFCRTVQEEVCDDPEYGSKEEWVIFSVKDIVLEYFLQMFCCDGRGVHHRGEEAVQGGGGDGVSNG